LEEGIFSRKPGNLTIMANIYEVIEEIFRFSTTIMTSYEGVDEQKINDFEKKYNVVLPDDYKILIRKTNGVDIMGTGVLGILDETVFASLDGAYKYFHYEVGNKYPPHLIPFSPDGGGNNYCFDSNDRSGDSCKIVFWRYDLTYDEDHPPEVVNESFAEWAKEVMIDWALEDYDYDGNKRE
jgi:cell wall assembly regulator SMI1